MKHSETYFREGDVVSIPLPSARFAIARVIHVSVRYKDIIGIIVYSVMNEEPSVEAIDLASDDFQPTIGPLYTSVEAAAHYRWKVLFHQQLSPRERELSKRIVGGAVEVGDEFIGPATRDEEKCLPHMLVGGMPVIYSEIEEGNSFFSKQVKLRERRW